MERVGPPEPGSGAAKVFPLRNIGVTIKLHSYPLPEKAAPASSAAKRERWKTVEQTASRRG